VSLICFPASITATPVHQSEPFQFHSNLGMFFLLNYIIALHRSAQISRCRHFKNRAETHLQETAAVSFQFSAAEIQLTNFHAIH
jgi:hypothetical protein